jgi:hypothetical protein
MAKDRASSSSRDADAADAGAALDGSTDLRGGRWRGSRVPGSTSPDLRR